MTGKLYTLKETIALIEQEKILVIAADDSLLKKLPDGRWIGGSNPYLLGEDGGKCSMDQLFVKDFTDLATNMNIRTYDETDIQNITTDAYGNGLIIAIMPLFSSVLTEFGVHSPTYENQYLNPLLGWVSGGVLGKTVPGDPTTYSGNKCFNDKAVAMHIELPDNKVGRLEIIDVLETDPNSDEITFDQDGFEHTKCRVNGEERDLTEYLKSTGFTWSLPLAANYAGAKINVALYPHPVSGQALFAAPVFKDTVYKFVTKVTDDYESAFFRIMGEDKDSNIVYSYSCIYNYLNFALEGKPLSGTCAAFTAGEIAYQLLNDTHVYLVIDEQK